MSNSLALLRLVLPVLSGPRPPLGARIFVPFALLLALLALYGCGTVIDREKLQDTVQASLEDSIHEKIQKVDCPSDQSVDPGATFTCDVTFSDDRREVATLEIRNEDADISMVGLKPKN
jgi:chromosome condensin MukBEF MukE localization factor